MATLSKMVFYGDYSSLHNFHLILSKKVNRTTNQKGKGEELEQVKHLITKIQELTSNDVITDKMKNYVRLQLSMPGTQEAFWDKVTTDIDGFTDEPVVQCDIEVIKNIFVDDSR